ncbi:MAG: energy-coupling factor transporter transmembrane protein EcfT [Propionibacteriaceae bacterium]|jgi:energy-coupling factor transport system permease protein|nr:energy-coupling factor transporter transmembrane protein EcfT [Propionibacteriaceae bacterium]
MKPTVLHPWAWWLWALCLGGVAGFTTNPLLLAWLALAVSTVTIMRRVDAPWARSVRAYFILAATVIVIRVFFQVLLGGSSGHTVLFVLPQIPLPEWAAGITLGGSVTLEPLLYSIYDAMRLAVILLCFGCANSLSSPRQALRSVPAALYEISVAIVIALSVAPQLIESIQRVAKARRLRGHSTKKLRGLIGLVIPVLGDAIDRSISLAASMQSRGFASRRGKRSAAALALMVSAAMLATFGVFLLLGTTWLALAVLCLIAGLLGVIAGMRLAGRRLQVTRFNPPTWSGREWLVAASGLLALANAIIFSGIQPGIYNPGTDPAIWPTLTLPALAPLVTGILVLIPTAPVRLQAPDAAVLVGRQRPLRPSLAAAMEGATTPAPSRVANSRVPKNGVLTQVGQ